MESIAGKIIEDKAFGPLVAFLHEALKAVDPDYFEHIVVRFLSSGDDLSMGPYAYRGTTSLYNGRGQRRKTLEEFDYQFTLHLFEFLTRYDVKSPNRVDWAPRFTEVFAFTKQVQLKVRALKNHRNFYAHAPEIGPTASHTKTLIADMIAVFELEIDHVVKDRPDIFSQDTKRKIDSFVRFLHSDAYKKALQALRTPHASPADDRSLAAKQQATSDVSQTGTSESDHAVPHDAPIPLAMDMAQGGNLNPIPSAWYARSMDFMRTRWTVLAALALMVLGVGIWFDTERSTPVATTSTQTTPLPVQHHYVIALGMPVSATAAHALARHMLDAVHADQSVRLTLVVRSGASHDVALRHGDAEPLNQHILRYLDTVPRIQTPAQFIQLYERAIERALGLAAQQAAAGAQRTLVTVGYLGRQLPLATWAANSQATSSQARFRDSSIVDIASLGTRPLFLQDTAFTKADSIMIATMFAKDPSLLPQHIVLQ